MAAGGRHAASPMVTTISDEDLQDTREDYSFAMNSSTGTVRSFWPTVVLLIGSGCAALIYEIVWFQMLQLVIGASAASLAVVLVAFMGGMCAGSLLIPRYVASTMHPLRAFATLEAAIGTWGALLIVVMPMVGRLYTAVDGGGSSSVVLRALASLVLLLPPAMLMGATLPVMSRCVAATPSGAARFGLLYGGNILGAVIGSLTAGFYLLPSFDLVTASLAAVSLNAVVACLAFFLATQTQTPEGDTVAERDAKTSRPTVSRSWKPRGVYAAIALSGFTALGAEVVWTRLLSLLFGATTYTFSLILAVFLVGLGVGSVMGASLARRTRNARDVLGWTQLGLSCAMASAAWMATRGLLHWPIDTTRAPGMALDVHTDVYRALLVIVPGALLWGMSFPLAVSAVMAVAPREPEHTPVMDVRLDAPGVFDDAGATVSRVYAANTFGAVAGAVLTSLLFIPVVGTQGAQRMLIVVAAVSAGLATRVHQGGSARRTPGSRVRLALTFALIAGVMAATVTPVPAGLVAWGRLFAWYGAPWALYVGEGANASIAVTEESNGWRNFHVSGKVEASTEPQDMRLQRLLGHLTALMHERGPKSALVVGFGAGVTAGAISIHPSVERVVVCELEPLIPKVVSRYFSDANYDVATDLKVRIVYDDARHYVLTAQEKFDIITSDPIHPWVKGAATLYTKEYFEHVRSRLNPGGVVTQWVPLYESTEDSVRSVIATFLQVFPDGSIWRNDDAGGQGYDAVLVGRVDERPIDVDAWQARLSRPDFEKVRRSLAEVGFESVADILATYLGRGRDLAPWVAGANINTDKNLRLQYLAGRAVNNNTGTQIRESILRYRRFPADLFVGTPETVSSLRALLSEPEAR